MPKSETFRTFVEARAGGSCEYCRLLQYASGVTFHLEHVHPKSAGGTTNLGNLALSCPGCNLAKAFRTSGADADGTMRKLFNPRAYEPWILGWHIHFSLNRDSGLIVAKTHVGDATIIALQMNSSIRSQARLLQIESGLIA